ncbi:hypothetical protein HMPREF9530_05662 [Escherichia coli MS 21-1]|nr:hypothetical protein HMPREF9530_05662 [Escherichia coli MS 21-1]
MQSYIYDTALFNAEMAGYPISCVGWGLAGFVYGVQHDPQDILAGDASCIVLLT